MIEGVFPKIDSLIPTRYANSIEFNKDELMLAIDRISLFVANDMSNIIKLSINNDGSVDFTANSSEIGAANEEITPINITSTDVFQFGFSYKYFLEALRAFDDESVSINITNNVKPFTITSKKDVNLVQLIVPVSIK